MADRPEAVRKVKARSRDRAFAFKYPYDVIRSYSFQGRFRRISSRGFQTSGDLVHQHGESGSNHFSYAGACVSMRGQSLVSISSPAASARARRISRVHRHACGAAQPMQSIARRFSRAHCTACRHICSVVGGRRAPSFSGIHVTSVRSSGSGMPFCTKSGGDWPVYRCMRRTL